MKGEPDGFAPVTRAEGRQALARRQSGGPAVRGPAASGSPAAPVTGAAVGPDEITLLNDVALRFFQRQLSRSWVPQYLEARGFPPVVQRRWQIGYAPGWDRVTRHLRSLGVPREVIAAAGLSRLTRQGTFADVFRDRAMLPIRRADGTLAGFIGRARPGGSLDAPKYVNSPHTALFDKSQVLFGLWEARELLADGARPVLVEGPFDAMAITSGCAGRFAGVAPCGTALTASQVEALSQAVDLRHRGVLVAFDSDQAGQRAAVRAYHLLSPHIGQVVAAALPGGCDPAGLFAEKGPAALAAALSQARPLADLVVDAAIEQWSRWLDHAEGRINALHAVAPVVAAMGPEHIARQVARLADRLGLDHAAVTKAVADAVPQALARRSACAAQRDHAGRPSLAAAEPDGASPRGRPAPLADPTPLRTRGVAT